MNKLNGGYIMIDGASSTLQADLQKAYESGKPVLYYENGKSEFVTIVKLNNKYFAIGSLSKTYHANGYEGDTLTRMFVFNTYVKNYLDIEIDDLGNLFANGSANGMLYSDEFTTQDNTYEVFYLLMAKIGMIYALTIDGDVIYIDKADVDRWEIIE